MFFRRGFAAVLILTAAAQSGWSSAGTEGASFLDIPVGGAPAALGSAYTAQAADVYAPIWNPAGLGFLESLEFTGMHLSYIGPVHYEHAGVVVPVGKDNESGLHTAGFGGSIQYLGANSLDARDDSGNPQGTFDTAFAAYSLAYGQRLTDLLSLGATAKFITEKIADATAGGYGADLGLMYKPTSKLSLGAAIVNIGPGIKFVSESDPLPLAGRFGAAYHWLPQWDISAEGVYRRSGLASGGLGIEWRYGDMFSFRGGYNTSHIKELGPVSGFTAGVGLFFWGQEFSYAWVPVGDLGQTHYFSLVFRTSLKARPERPRLKSSEDRDFQDMKTEDPGRYQNIFDILGDDEQKAIK